MTKKKLIIPIFVSSDSLFIQNYIQNLNKIFISKGMNCQFIVGYCIAKRVSGHSYSL